MKIIAVSLLISVSLTASANGSSDIETKTQVIQVLPAPTAIPYSEGFENLTTLNNNSNWAV